MKERAFILDFSDQTGSEIKTICVYAINGKEAREALHARYPEWKAFAVRAASDCLN